MEEPSVAILQDYTYATALYYDVSPELMENIITCESSWNITARGALGEKGLVQIFPRYWPEESKQADDPFFSINFLGKKLAEGKDHLWSCNRLTKKDPEKYQKLALELRNATSLTSSKP